jgi:nucleotidyltransferase/DNA polymerase involved in DNA repair
VPTRLFHRRRVWLSIVVSGHGVQHFAKARCGPCLVRYAQAPRWSLRISRACSYLADNQWQIKRMASNQRKKQQQQQQQLVINIRSDSKTSVEQLQGISEVRDSLMQRICAAIKKLLEKMMSFMIIFNHLDRTRNIAGLLLEQRPTERFGRNIALWMWKVANGSEDEPVHPREDSVSLSTEQTLGEFNKDRILVYANELVDELYGRLIRRGYMFRIVGVYLVRTVFSVETREMSFPGLQARLESISSVIEQLLDTFSFGDSAPAVRKVGFRVRNLVSVHGEEGQIRPQKSQSLITCN